MHPEPDPSLNVIGEPLSPCSTKPLTGFFRDGHCNTCPEDLGRHTVCVVVTEAFLEFSQLKGNDLITPRPEYQFPGLKEGDRWCLCAMRWKEAWEAGVAPRVHLAATHQRTLEVISLSVLQEHSLDD
ncbi:MAG: DUF2237 family protein [Verrucomicrobiales bacterium]